MKKFFIIFLVVILLLIGALIAIPYFFKDELVATLKTEMSDQMASDINFDKVSISILKNFPELSLQVTNFSMESWDSTMSVKMDNFYFNMEAMSYFRDKTIRIRQIVFEEPHIFYLNTDTGVSEAPKTIDAESVASSSDEVEEDVKIYLDQFMVNNGHIHFADSALQMVADLKGFNLDLSGNFSESSTDILIRSSLDELLVEQNNVKLINNLPANFEAQIAADLDKFEFTLKENKLKLGPVDLKLDGNVSESAEGWIMDLKFDAPGMNMKKLLTMIPATYATSIADLKTDGNIALNGVVKGAYVDMEHLPMFSINFKVDNGYFQYPDLPESVQSINIIAAITHPDNEDMDATVIVVDQFECLIGTNPLQSQWKFKTPVSDMHIDGYLKGNMDLATLKDVFPMDSADLSGKVIADVKLRGNMSAIEKEEYENFYAAGFMKLNGFKFASNDIPQGLYISDASMDFTPSRINLKNFKGKMGRSDISLSGYLTNYISYTFRDGTLTGRLNHYSELIDANEFLDSDDNADIDTDTIEGSVIIIPDKLDLTFTSNIQNLYFDNLHITGTNGVISVKNRIANLDNLMMKMLNGSMIISGQYNSNDTLNVFSDMKLQINGIDIAQGVDAFTSIKKIAPIATYAEGKISSSISYYAPFDPNGEIIMDKLESKGYLSSKTLHIKNNASLDQLAKVTNNPRYKDLRTNSFKVNYTVKDGKVVVEPFKVTVEDKDMEIWGNHNLNNTMDYSIKTTVAPRELGDEVGSLLSLVSDPNKQLPVTIKIKGNVKKPSISLDAKEAIKELQKNAGGILKGLFN